MTLQLFSCISILHVCAGITITDCDYRLYTAWQDYLPTQLLGQRLPPRQQQLHRVCSCMYAWEDESVLCGTC